MGRNRRGIMSSAKAKLAWRNRKEKQLKAKENKMSWINELKEDFNKGKNWLGENKAKMESLGEEGVKLFNLVNGMFNGGTTVETPQVFTKWADVNEILNQAQGVQEVIDNKLGSGFLKDLLDVVSVGVKVITLGASLL